MSDASSNERPKEPETNPRLWGERVVAIRNMLIPAVIKHLSIVGQEKAQPIAGYPAIVLRDSLLIRAGSLGFHVDLIRRQFHAYFVKAHDHRHGSDSINLLYNAHRDVLYLADDVLLNAMSMLDYLGNLVGFILTRNKATLKWQGVVNSGRDRANPLASKTVVATMVRLDAEWVQAVAEIRATIIHNKSALGDRSQNVTSQLNDEGLVPTRLSLPIDWATFKRVKFLNPRAGDEHIELVDGAEQIALAALEAVAVVVQELLHELGGPLQTSAPEGA
jgi:hypothetical protein